MPLFDILLCIVADMASLEELRELLKVALSDSEERNAERLNLAFAASEERSEARAKELAEQCSAQGRLLSQTFERHAEDTNRRIDELCKKTEEDLKLAGEKCEMKYTEILTSIENTRAQVSRVEGTISAVDKRIDDLAGRMETLDLRLTRQVDDVRNEVGAISMDVARVEEESVKTRSEIQDVKEGAVAAHKILEARIEGLRSEMIDQKEDREAIMAKEREFMRTEVEQAQRDLKTEIKGDRKELIVRMEESRDRMKRMETELISRLERTESKLVKAELKALVQDEVILELQREAARSLEEPRISVKPGFQTHVTPEAIVAELREDPQNTLFHNFKGGASTPQESVMPAQVINIIRSGEDRPKKFTGQGNVTPKGFLREIQEYISDHRIPPDRQLRTVERFLDGAPLMWYKSFRYTFGNMEEFRSAFLKTYWSVQSQQDLRLELYSRRYNTSAPTKYAEYFTSQLYRMRELDSPPTEAELVSAIEKQLPIDVQKILLASHATTAVQAEGVLRRLDQTSAHATQRHGRHLETVNMAEIQETQQGQTRSQGTNTGTGPRGIGDNREYHPRRYEPRNRDEHRDGWTPYVGGRGPWRSRRWPYEQDNQGRGRAGNFQPRPTQYERPGGYQQRPQHQGGRVSWGHPRRDMEARRPESQRYIEELHGKNRGDQDKWSSAMQVRQDPDIMEPGAESLEIQADRGIQDQRANGAISKKKKKKRQF